MTDAIDQAAKAYYEAEITSGVFGSKPLAWENSMLRKVRERRIEFMRTALESAGLQPAPSAATPVERAAMDELAQETEAMGLYDRSAPEAGDSTADGESCCTQCPGPIRYLCTEPIGHDGDHVATRDEGVVITSWPAAAPARPASSVRDTAETTGCASISERWDHLACENTSGHPGLCVAWHAESGKPKYWYRKADAPTEPAPDLERAPDAPSALAPAITAADDAHIWVALDFADDSPITTPLKSRAEVDEWLRGQYDDVDARAAVITVGEYLASGGYDHQHGAAIARAVAGFVGDTESGQG